MPAGSGSSTRGALNENRDLTPEKLVLAVAVGMHVHCAQGATDVQLDIRYRALLGRQVRVMLRSVLTEADVFTRCPTADTMTPDRRSWRHPSTDDDELLPPNAQRGLSKVSATIGSTDGVYRPGQLTVTCNVRAAVPYSILDTADARVDL